MIRSLALAAIAGATLLLHGPWPFAGTNWPSTGGWVGIVATAVLLSLPVAHAGLTRIRSPRASAGVALLAAMLGGAGLAGGEVLERLAQRWPNELAGSDRLVSGTIVSLPRALQGLAGPPASRFDVRVDRIDCPTGQTDCALPEVLPHRLQVLDRTPERRYAAGQRWRWPMRLQPPDGALNPGSFDRERWLLSERVDALGSVRRGPVAHLGGGDRLSGWLDRQRQRVTDALIALPAAVGRMEQGDPQVITALALGRSDSITPDWRERLRNTGTSHLIAISGLHVGLVFAGVFALVTRLRPRVRRSPDEGAEPASPVATRRVPVSVRALARPDAIALLAAGAYAALAGFGLPVQRALVMLAVLVIVRRRARLVAPGSTLALAVIGVLLLDPLAPLSGGFWLSAGAVAVLVGSGVGAIGQGGAGWRRRGWQTLRAQGWLTLALVPVGAFAFQQVSLVSAPVNLLAIPYVGGVVVPLSLLSTLWVALDIPMANLVLGLTLQSVAALRVGLDAAAAVPAASLVASLPGATALGLCLCGLLLAGTMASVRPGRGWFAIVPLLALSALPAALWAVHGRPVRGIELHVLDVGHGLAALVLTPRHTLLFDTGGGRGEATRAQRVVMPYLHGLGRQRIDRLLLSHLDADHAAGLPWLAARFPELAIVAPGVAEALERLPSARHAGAPALALPPGQRMTACRAGEGFELDGLSVDFLHPAAHDGGSRNDLSCVALLSFGGVRLLMSGDIEAAAEKRLVERAGALPVDVLLAPHHGSSSSSTAAFVAAFPARDVVFAAGRRSRWGFPHAVTRMRYKMSGARLHTVGETGALVFRFDPVAVHDGCCVPESARLRVRRLWRQP